jgi:hypothetical protein
MEISVFTSSRPYVENNNAFDNQIPDASLRRGNPFWGFVGNMLGLEPEQYPASTGPLDWQLDAVARRDERMRALNLPPTRGEVVAGIVGDVVEAVKKVAKVTKTAAAVEWLASVLRDGPRPQREIEEMARKEKIGTKPLKVAKKKLKVESVRKGANFFSWRLPFAKAPKGGQP